LQQQLRAVRGEFEAVKAQLFGFSTHTLSAARTPFPAPQAQKKGDLRNP
jgi:hypothetical protein